MIIPPDELKGSDAENMRRLLMATGLPQNALNAKARALLYAYYEAMGSRHRIFTVDVDGVIVGRYEEPTDELIQNFEKVPSDLEVAVPINQVPNKLRP